MASEFRNHLYDRIHLLSKRIMVTTDPSNPLRAPSTSKAVADEIKGPMCEILSLYELLGRLCPDERVG